MPDDGSVYIIICLFEEIVEGLIMLYMYAALLLSFLQCSAYYTSIYYLAICVSCYAVYCVYCFCATLTTVHSGYFHSCNADCLLSIASDVATRFLQQAGYIWIKLQACLFAVKSCSIHWLHAKKNELLVDLES